MRSLKLQPCALSTAGGGFSSRAAAVAGRGREVGRVSDGEASALPLSRSNRSLVCSSCLHRSTQSEERDSKHTGPVDITAMTHREDRTLDFNTWSL